MLTPFTATLFSLYLFIFLIGLFVGSFLNVVADRVVRGEKFLTGRSHCDFCNTVLKVVDLVPVFSFLSTGGRCRYCERKLSIAYPLSEVFTGLLFVMAASLANLGVGFSAKSLVVFGYYVVVFSFYIVIFLADIKYQLIPNKVVVPGIVFVLLGGLFFRVWEFFDLRSSVSEGALLRGSEYVQNVAGQYLSSWGFSILIAAAIGGFFWFLFAITRGKGMGFGDVRLAFMIGLFNVYPNNILAIFSAFVLGSVFGVGLMLLGGKGMKDKIAFGPFMVVGSVVALVFGDLFFKWYLGL
jgi:leader peptidase (prepilin peptidase) / N-methyltransferase